MEHGTAESVGATISFKTNNLKGPGSLRLVAAKCGGRDFLEKISLPVAEMSLRGLGGSKVSPNAPQGLNNAKSYLKDIDAVIKAAKGGKQTALLGYSHGGYFVTAYAIANPRKVSALILMEPALFTSKADLLRRARLASAGDVSGSIGAMLKYVEPKLARSESLGQRESVAKAVQSGETLASEFRVRAEHPIKLSQLKKLKMPILLIGGADSAQKSSVTKIAEAIPSASVWWVKDANHLALIEPKFAAQIASVVDTFLES